MQGLFKNPLVLALLASVLLNGVLIGKAASGSQTDGPPAMAEPRKAGPGPRGGPRGGPIKLETLPRYLTPEQRLKFDVLAKSGNRASVRDAFKDLRIARRVVIDLAGQDPLDAAALRDAMNDVRLKADALAMLSDETIAAYLETLSPEQRSDILKSMNRPGRRDGRGGTRKGPGGER